jgi:OmpA-OmpF porin, OOP family
MHMPIRQAILGCILAFAAAHAAGQPFVGLGIGRSNLEDHAERVSLVDPGSRLDGEDTAWKLFAGYHITRRFGVEAAYVRLGKARYEGTTFGIPVTGGAVEVWGINVAALGIFPVSERLTLLGKAGLFLSETEISETADGAPFSDSFRSWHPSVGIGAAYRLRPNLALRAEWEYFKLDPRNADLFSLGLQYSF